MYAKYTAFAEAYDDASCIAAGKVHLTYRCGILESNRMAGRVDNRVQFFRNKAGVTQEALAERVGVSRQTIIAIEKGNYTPSVLLALRIASYFKTRVEDVFSIV